jgi:CHAT domain-containing protein/tetratricopeptide (TPR) repeat protein
MSNEPKAGKGIDPEMLAAYIDNRLPPEQRAAVEAQLATDPESYALLVDTLEALDDDEIRALEVKEPSKQPIPFEPRAPKSSKSPLRNWMIAGGALAAAAAIVLAVMQPSFLKRYLGRDVDPRLERLVAAVGKERYVESRLSGGFSYGPLRSATRASTDLSTQNLGLLAAAGELQQQASLEPSGQHLHEWGIAQVQLGELDNAIATLSKSRELLNDDPVVLSDLAAAHLARAVSQSRADDWPIALELAERAVQKNPSLKEALYNRAIALEGLALTRQAEAAWTAYLGVETDAEWRNEAQERIKRLGVGVKSLQDDPADTDVVVLAATNPQRARELFETRLLRAWASAVLENDSAKEAHAYSIAAASASALTARGYRGPGRVIEELRTAAGVAQRRALANGYLSYALAVSEFENDRVPQSGPLFADAARFLGGTNSPYRYWAKFSEATVMYFNGQLPAAATQTARLKDEAGVREIPELYARVLWGLGLFALVQGDLQNSLIWYRQSADLYERLGEAENATFLNTLTAEALDFSGDTEGAWTHRLRALTRREPSRNVRRPHTTLLNAAVAAMRQDMPEVATHLADEAVMLVQDLQQQRLQLEAVLYRGRARALAGKMLDAERDLQDAQGRLQGMPAPLKTRYAAEIQLTRSFFSNTDVEALTASSEKFLRENGTTVRVPQLQLTLARARAKAGDVTAARTLLKDAISQVASSSSGLSEGLRWSYADQSWPVFREAAILELQDGGDVIGALDIAEMGRLAHRVRPDVEKIAGALPPGEVVVRFLVGDARLHAVVLSARGVQDVAIDVAAGDLERLGQRFRSALARHETATGTLREVGRMLVDPWLVHVPAGDLITVVPDGPLHFVSLAPAILADGRRLIQRNALRTAPDLAPAQKRGAARQGPIVAVGVSKFDRDGLVNLPGAEAEANAIGEIYPGSRVITGGAAQVDQVLSAARGASVLHLATHGAANPDYPNLSWVALRADPSHAQGLLFSHQIRAAELGGLALVFLSMCDGSQGRLSLAEGEASLARAFIDAGVGAVVASSWRVGDAMALEFSKLFHVSFAATRDPIAALRAAQLAAIESSNPTLATPQSWGAFRVFSRVGFDPQETTR